MSSIFYYEPFYDFERLMSDAISNRKSGDQQVQRDRGDGAVRAIKPRMDLHEDQEKNMVTANFEFPGLLKKDVDIQVHNNRLTVSAETKQSSDKDEGGYAVRERMYGKFSRTLQLPPEVKEKEIKATMENGLLTITFPKVAPQQAPKKITVQ